MQVTPRSRMEFELKNDLSSCQVGGYLDQAGPPPTTRCDLGPVFRLFSGDELKKGKQLGDRTYKVHLDGYNQLDLITGKGPSKRREIIYFAEGTLGAVRLGDYKYRFIDQPGGWLGGTVKPDFQLLTNLRLDPMERTVLTGSQAYLDWMKYAFWRFVFVQNVAAEFAETFLEFPPMQKPATFNLTAVIGQVRGRPGALTPSGRSKG